MTGPFKIITKKHGIMYKHTLMLYNAEIGFKVSNSPIAPQWMRGRQATGNTSHFLDGTYQPPKTVLTKGVEDRNGSSYSDKPHRVALREAR